ncbi:MAG: hypothetical protein IJX63_09405 [Lachnospiraceae bacterium]|nr:hypothetical protein [Lachnospiraceae bacterium]
MWNTVIELFRNYMGTGLIIAWFLVCLVYLFRQEKDKGRRVLFLYVPAILFLLFFNPLFMNVVYGIIGEEIYYRILWLIPVTIVIAYTIGKIYGTLKGKKAIGFLGISAVLIVVSGSCIYTNPAFAKAENLYHVPEEVREICDAIEVEGREVMAVFPQELISYVRQYSPMVCMPYGREVLVERWRQGTDFYVAMEAELLNAEIISGYAKQSSCHYVIIRADKQVIGDFEDYDYVEFARVGNYIVYYDTTIYIGLEYKKKE